MLDESSEVPTLLVVEDDPDLQTVLTRILTGEGYQVLIAADGEAGLAEALGRSPDLVILDVGLPVKDGVEVVRELRERGFRAPALMLTARGSLEDRVTGLEAGADDYLPKPFELPELIARVKALLRRAALNADGTLLRVRDIVLDPLKRRVERNGQEVELSGREFALLEYLMRNEGRVVSRQMIGEQAWHQPPEPVTNVVDVYIAYLRKKLGHDEAHPLIETVRKTGYVMRG
ncbi:MAG TPA: response regulator transcription factor [Gemmatimonadaceae bacterium]|nr:response regulator transcription factor [Gemmatimonadaceae bacterium]